MTRMNVQLPAQKPPSVTVEVGPKARRSIAEIARSLDSVSSIVVLHDESVAAIAREIATLLPGAHLISVASGDGSKSLSEVERIVGELLKLHCDRKSLIINIGGGMLTDLGGFVASLFMRGVRFIHVPTTLLGMVDAAVGGKTGVNVAGTKNIVGTITHPLAIIADTELLQALPDDMLKEGLVEVIKIAAMADRKFFEWLEARLDVVVARDPRVLQKCVESAIRLKQSIVERDEREGAQRMHLNFGHTVGHAVEALSKYSLSHGKAIAIGMSCEMRLANVGGRERVEGLLARLGLSLTIPHEFSESALWDVMQHDKKNVGSQMRIAVPTEIGSGIVRSLTEQEFSRALR